MSHDSLLQRLATLADLKAQAKEAEDRRKALEEELSKEMATAGIKRDHWPSQEPGKYHTATLVESSTIQFDENGLKQALSEEQWASVTKSVLDSKALEDQVARGLIPVDLVVEHSTEVPRKPYIKFSVVKEENLEHATE